MSDTTVMTRLRTETRDLHDTAEGRRFQQRMVAGELSRGDFADWLGQMLVIHRELEARLVEHRDDPRFAAVRDEQMQAPYLRDDLAVLGVEDTAITALPATRRLVADIVRASREDPLALLGFHYVLEGSNNGNRFIADKLLPALDLTPTRGGRYLAPYGDDQPAKWRQFKADMNAVGFATAETDTLVAAARRMFEGVSEISDELRMHRDASA